MKKRVKLRIFLVAFIIVGTVITFIGAKDIYIKNVLSRDWTSIDAEYIGKELYVSPNHPTGVSGKYAQYWLYYSFVVDDQEYTVKTDYITRSIPDQGSTEVIKYNPNNPKSTVFVNQAANVPLFIAGLLFLAFPLIIIAAIFKNAKVFFILFGASFFVFGFLFYYLRVSIILAVIFMAAGIVPIVTGVKSQNNEPDNID